MPWNPKFGFDFYLQIVFFCTCIKRVINLKFRIKMRNLDLPANRSRATFIHGIRYICEK